MFVNLHICKIAVNVCVVILKCECMAYNVMCVY